MYYIKKGTIVNILKQHGVEIKIANDVAEIIKKMEGASEEEIVKVLVDTGISMDIAKVTSTSIVIMIADNVYKN